MVFVFDKNKTTSKSIAEQVVNDIRRNRFRILERFPPFFSIISDVNIYVTRDIPTAGVDPNGDFLINPDFWNSLSDDDKIVVLLHEAMHSKLHHHERFYTQDVHDMMLWNLATDAFINSILIKLFPRSRLFDAAVLPRNIYELIKRINPYEAKKYKPDDFEKMNEEEMYRALLKAITKIPYSQQQFVFGTISETVKESTLERGVFKESYSIEGVDESLTKPVDIGEYKNDEHKKTYGSVDKGTEKDMDRMKKLYEIKKAIEDVAKTIGVDPGKIKEIIDKLKPRGSINWTNYLISTVNRLLMNQVISTYSRPSRRYETLPGYRRMIKPSINAVFAIDVSGSITSKMLQKFFEEVVWAKTLLGDRLDGYVITWDVDVQNIIKLSDIKPGDSVAITGRGGTVIDEALKKIIEISETTPIDMVVILTDGYIELNNKKLPEILRNRIKHGIVLYTDTTPPGFDKRWEIIRYNV